MPDSDLLVDELAAYERMKDMLLRKYEGRVVVIRNGEVIGIYDSEEEAFKSVIEKYGPVPVLIKRVVRKEEPERLPSYTYGLLSVVID